MDWILIIIVQVPDQCYLFTFELDYAVKASVSPAGHLFVIWLA